MNRNLLFTLLIVVFCSSCSEFIEPSISKSKVQLLAPADLMESNSYQQTFWWETVADAFQYRLQIVTPSFNNTERLILDTVVNTDKFIYTLDPGNYQWRVRAENGSSETAFTVQSFVIYPSSLTTQSVQLGLPANDLYTSNPSISYQWLKLFGATQYRLQVDNNSFADETKLVLNQVTDNLSFIQNLTDEGKYQFRVRAENATETSKWSVVRNFTYDVTPPGKVQLTAPGNKQTVTKPVKLLWDTVTGADKYELAIYQSDSVTLFSTAYPQVVATNTVNFNAGDAGAQLVWRVRAIDKTGNKGNFSDFFSFKLQ